MTELGESPMRRERRTRLRVMATMSFEMMWLDESVVVVAELVQNPVVIILSKLHRLRTLVITMIATNTPAPMPKASLMSIHFPQNPLRGGMPASESAWIKNKKERMGDCFQIFPSFLRSPDPALASMRPANKNKLAMTRT